MGEVVMPSGAAYKPPPLSVVRKGAYFEVESSRGNRIVGGFVDGSEGASFTVIGSTPTQEHAIRVFIRDGMALDEAGRMLRAIAEELLR